MTLFTLDALNEARSLVHRHMPPTPQYAWPLLAERTGAELWVKHENHTPTGAFKVRGGMVLISKLSPEAKRLGVVSASTGNHGQSIAYAAREFGARAMIFAPAGANPTKVQAMRGLGAEVVLEGKDFEAAKAAGMAMAEKEGMRFISSGDEPDLIAGVGTYGLEIMQERPEVEMIFVPIGGGSGAAGTCIAAKGIRPDVRVIGVQAAAAQAAYLTWKRGEPTEAPLETEAEGLATGAPFQLPQSIMGDLLDDFLLVDDLAMRKAVRLLLEKAGVLAEHGGAAPLAAAMQMAKGENAEALHGKTIALIVSGGNISPAHLRLCLDA